MRNDIERVFFTADEIEAKVAALGEQISKDFEGKNPLFVGVLKGCFVFMADLMRHVSIPALWISWPFRHIRAEQAPRALSRSKKISARISKAATL